LPWGDDKLHPPLVVKGEPKRGNSGTGKKKTSRSSEEEIRQRGIEEDGSVFTGKEDSERRWSPFPQMKSGKAIQHKGSDTLLQAIKMETQKETAEGGVKRLVR